VYLLLGYPGGYIHRVDDPGGYIHRVDDPGEYSLPATQVGIPFLLPRWVFLTVLITQVGISHSVDNPGGVPSCYPGWCPFLLPGWVLFPG